MYPIKLKQILPTEKRCIIISGNEDKSLRRIVFTYFNSEKEFEEQYNEIAKIEKTKQILTGKQFSGGLFCVATDFKNKGIVPEKQLIELIRNITRKHKWAYYPSSNIQDSYKMEHLHRIGVTQHYWSDEIPVQEADYVSMFIATHKALQMNNFKTFMIDGNNLNDFQDLLKELAQPTFANPDVYITNKELTTDHMRSIDRIKPKMVILFGNSILTHDKAVHLMKQNIQIIPSSLTEMGNMIVSEGHFNNCRSVEESFQLINTACTELNVTLWKYVQNYRENMYTVLDEIYQAYTDENKTSRFRLSYKDIGAMSYLA